MDKHDVIVQAVEHLKKSEFQATGIKVELEAQLNRRDASGYDCSHCYRGYIDCPDCSGDYEGEFCYDCDGDGYTICGDCEDGWTYDSDDNEIRCEECSDGRIDCGECEGEGRRGNCENCSEGRVECEECVDQRGLNYSNTKTCQNFILQHLAEYGLATCDEGSRDFTPIYPLVFAKFYNDGSVDSELTFTLALDDPENIFLLPKFIDAFNALAEVAGDRFETKGAGMHMALINDPDCKYPTSGTTEHQQRSMNFGKSMQHLIPALYFLGSNNEVSRSLNYRRPGIGIRGDKYNTVSYRGGSLEFRVFETCYHNPETILDNVVVMSNTMKYWTLKYKPLSLQKIAGKYKFGIDSGNKLDRLYVTAQHIDLLNAGLRLLKPSYYTIKELKKQRNFTRTRRYEQTRLTEAKKDAEVSYKEYENRFQWAVELHRLDKQYSLTSRMQSRKEPMTPQAKGAITKEVNKVVKEYEKTKTPLAQYIDQKVKEAVSKVGQYELGAV